MKKVTKKELRKTALKLLPAIYDSAMRTGAEDGLFQHEDWRTGLCLDAFLLAEAFEKTANYRDAEPEPQLKKLDQSIFDGLDEKWRFAAVDADGSARAYNYNQMPIGGNHEPHPDQSEKGFEAYKFIGTGYDTSDWQNSLIERDLAKEPTGSDLVRAMLAMGDKYVMCAYDNGYDNHPKAISISEYGDLFYINGDYKYGVLCGNIYPINNQGEPLTASEVGL